MVEKKRALIVDDDAAQRQRLKTILHLRGFDTEEAGDGSAGLKVLESGKFDVVFCDVSMPNMNGFEFLSRVKHSPRLHGLPIIMLTSESRPEDKARGERLGCAAYVLKPFNSQKLDDALAAAKLAAR